MSKIRTSPDRWSFHSVKARERYLENADDTDALELIDFYEKFKMDARSKEQEDEWTNNNLEHDLRASDYIAEKCKDEVYAQNLYAALCNNSFLKKDVWVVLKDDRWSCSWRYAGGIISDIREEGDYIDWYCSGINQTYTEEELQEMDPSQQERAHLTSRFVCEGVVTDEIVEDLDKIGWIVIKEED